ncbi:MAG: class I SAM-dependent methyltransferase [Pseudotabrizicola sp.]|uniref:SAM-dependent methyltransferase n=1 Tax=Pseudotabrizicola sp. TaxID=2939647 RepID=UPI002731184A|nr:class I SAM-dependent methyltransferase [Pseudotabrizicola sp.]MDP2081939.1 class I SAM-dependent methyltransferase [Pseudotabrizicola sp.]MDZ7576011.1 class I SAM-dependent methyltransferase [Pseudotabrizicola sp.]
MPLLYDAVPPLPEPQNIDIAQEAESELIRSLDISMFSAEDLLNLILQRSEVLFDLPRSGRIIRAWNGGDEAPIRDCVQTYGETIARRAAGVIYAEYRALAPILLANPAKRVADIGCGYGFFDLFLARDSKASVLLIDIEQNTRRHFGYAVEGAAYSNLSIARRLLESNGVAAKRIETLNPEREDLTAAAPVDLAVSFLSCGFHYPASSYAAYFRDGVAPGGKIMLDLRAATADAQMVDLEGLGAVEDLAAPPKARRILLRKPPAVKPATTKTTASQAKLKAASSGSSRAR